LRFDRIWQIGALVGVAGVSIFLFHNCGVPRVSHQVFPPIGQPVDLKPVSGNKPVKPDNEYRNVLVYFGLGGRTLDYEDDVTVEMYESDQAPEPVYRFSTAELKAMYATTNCDRGLLRYLENAYLGDALFCGFSLELSRVHHFVAKKANGETKTATSYITEFANEEDDLIAITINMF